MLNIIKMNFYRMVRTKSTWNILIILFAFSVLVTFMNFWEAKDPKIQEAKNKQEAQAEQQEDNVTIGIQMNPLGDSREGQQEPYLLERVCADLSTGIIPLFIAIFAVLFLHGEEKHGFIKNLIGKTKTRWSLYVAKNIVVFAFSGLSLLVYSLGVIISGLFFFPEAAFGFPMLGKTLIYMLVMWMLHGAFGCAAGCLITMTRSTAASITISMFVAMGVIVNLSYYVNKFLPWLKINLMQYQLVSNIQGILYNSPAKALLFAAAVAVVYLVLYNVIGSVWTEKRDVV